MNYRLLTTIEAQVIYCALIDEKDKLIEVNMESIDQQSIIGNIYIGKVANFVKGMNIAFVNIGLENDVFLALDKRNSYYYTNGKASKEELKIGDEILVQVIKEAHMKKPPSVTSNISFTGKYSVLTAGKNFVGLSSKINDDNERLRLKKIFKPFVTEEYGFIVRTNAVNVEESLLVEEIQDLVNRHKKIIEKAKYSPCFTCLYKQPPLYLKMIRDLYYKDIEAYLFDDKNLYNHALESFEGIIKEGFKYMETNNYNLYKLFSLSKKMEDALSKRVFLKSGATLVIEHTEALTVIDVNSAKASSKKNKEKALYDINFEAANEVARQLRLRNISGIVIVDFIDMKVEENNHNLLNHLKLICERDKIKTTVIDMTTLGLVEITRKKEGMKLLDKVKLVKNSENP